MNTDAQPATVRPYVRRAEPDNSFWYVGQLMSALAEGEDTGGRHPAHLQVLKRRRQGGVIGGAEWV